MNKLPRFLWLTFAILVIAATSAQAAPLLGFTQTNLVSNISGLAAVTDPDLRNPWGISFSATSPFWVADNGSGLSTLYNTAGTKQGLVVTIPGGLPTGTVFSNVAGSFNGDTFLFVTQNGTLVGWRNALGTTAETLAIAPDSTYTGLALGAIGSSTYAYAANFETAKIDVYKGNSAFPDLPGNFTDPNLPAGYAPFNIQNINGQLYVMYAAVNPSEPGEEMTGPGLGFVDVFNLNGTLDRRLVSQGALDAPWGIAKAPATFGALANAFLIGNFGDGTINAFSSTGMFLGTLANTSGNPLVNDGLWALMFGNGGNGGNSNSLYLTAGLNDEADGLFARIDAPQAVPEPGTLSLLTLGFAAWQRRRINLRGPFVR